MEDIQLPARLSMLAANKGHPPGVQGMVTVLKTLAEDAKMKLVNDLMKKRPDGKAPKMPRVKDSRDDHALINNRLYLCKWIIPRTPQVCCQIGLRCSNRRNMP